jgi:superfamily I DNA/RNA helicase
MAWSVTDPEALIGSRPDFVKADRRFAQSWKTVYVDEAQDCNKTELLILAKYVRAGAELVFVGDPMQRLYAYRGCVNVFDRDTLYALLMPYCNPATPVTWMPLSSSFRVPRAIVAQVQEVLGPRFPCVMAMSAVRRGGKVRHLSRVTALKAMRPCSRRGKVNGTTMVLARTNLTLVQLAVQYLNTHGAETPTHSLSLSCGSRLKFRMQSRRAQDVDTDAIAVANADNDSGPSESFPGPEDDEASLDAALKYIRDNYTGGAKGLHPTRRCHAFLQHFQWHGSVGAPLTTVHCIKGMEADRVMLPKDIYAPPLPKGEPTDEAVRAQLESQDCLLFVAMTRAKKRLVYIVQ